MDKKVVLITGASSGIGKSCAEYLYSKGFRVYGTSRKWSNVTKNKPGDDLITMLYMDVTDRASITNAVEEIILIEGRIDVVINNAGMGMAGSIEDSSYDEIKLQFDTNLFGAFNVINEVLMYMRQEKSGLIINIGSMAGLISIPFFSNNEPFSTSSPCSKIFSFEFGLVTEISFPFTTTSSFITTISVPSGIMAPVMMLAQVPGSIFFSGFFPAGINSMTCKELLISLFRIA